MRWFTLLALRSANIQEYTQFNKHKKQQKTFSKMRR